MNLTGPPEPVLYHLLFKTADGYAKLAAKREAAGKDSSALRQFFAHQGGMTAGENGVIFQVASDEIQAEQPDIAAESKLIADWRAASRAHALGQGPAPPPPPLDQLKQLDAHRDAIAMNARSQLHLLLGDDGFNRLEVLVHGKFGRARVMKLTVPGEPGDNAPEGNRGSQ